MARTDACTHQADRRRRCLPSVEMPEVGRTDTGTDEAAKEDKAREVARESVHGGAPGGRRGALTLLNAACRQAAAAASGLPRIARPGLAWHSSDVDGTEDNYSDRWPPATSPAKGVDWTDGGRS